MLVELKNNQFKRVKNLFKDLSFHLSIDSVIHNISEGRIFTDQVKTPKVAFLIGPEGMYCGGNPNVSEFNKALNHLLKTDVFKKAKDKELVDYVVFYPNQDWEESIKMIFTGLFPMKDTRLYYELDMNEYSYQLTSDVIPIDDNLLNSKMPGVNQIKDILKNNFKSLKDYYSHQIGFLVTKDEQVASWCIADCVVNNQCEIGVETAKNFRKQKL